MIACRRGFTLVEMMLATALAALLMAGVLTVTGTLARDGRRMQAERPAPLPELIRRDLVNSTAMVVSADGENVVLVGHAGIDPKTLTSTGRLTAVTYELRGRVLVREQRYLDDAIRPEPWREVVAAAVKEFAVSGQGEPVQLGEDVGGRLKIDVGRVTRVPSRVRVRLVMLNGAVEEEVAVR